MRKFISEFKTFLTQGSMLDLAIAVIIGGAFQVMLTSLVNDIFMPFIGIVTGSIALNDIVWLVGSAEVKIGSFLSNAIIFVLTGFVVFMMVKILNTIRKPVEEEEEIDPTVALLTEIRDELARKN
ncbi:large conductance mechanosensitive channel protein MscL [Weissella ceti]|uniref:Large-conductance mechanosensitive channel n=1 Tax=Weissella ceti TaxID=759620 RepID=A0ABT3E2R3_9LACO|nr:large conductance mechanosensitive channel protein MscL [Weissella ceti]MCW0952718.1 large conductance mechanosensitive channel protein MscL [Weissella ceti]QVK12420.1 large conductance mechanosensitive channel protein MscL [Weissella ceti]